MSECPHNEHGCSVEVKIDRIEFKIDRFIERVSKVETVIAVMKNFTIYLMIPVILFLIKKQWG